jgi:D-alanine-D-alanine ligase-like ATP-grasp enzyme
MQQTIVIKVTDDAPDDVPLHYTYVVRTLIDLYRRSALPAVASIEVEAEWGYTARIHYRDGSTRMTYGNDIGLNSGAAADVVKDKAYTKLFLRNRGLVTPRGDAFLLQWWAERMSSRARTVAPRTAADAQRYAEALGLPVYVKPVDGSKGAGVFRCEIASEVTDALDALNAMHARVALVEEAVDLPDFRLVVLGSEVISAYRRIPLTVHGDGRSTVLQLLMRLEEQYRALGRDTQLDVEDTRIVRSLARRGLVMSSIPALGQAVVARDISNLSAGGTAEDITSEVAAGWRQLALEAASSFGLNFCGVDLACAGIDDDAARYSILEVNAAPGLDHYAAVGADQERVVRDLYAKVLNASPAT